MIGKIKKGKSFGGCIRYVMGKDNAEIIDSDGVLLGNIREITDSFNYQRELNPKIKQPVGHIALSFKPEDKALLTDEFMAKIAREYMELMGIKNTQFILVRHHNTDNPHCHLVYNRIGYDGKVISSQGDYKRNEIATKLLKDKYGLTYAEGKGKTNVEKLHASERVKYEIFNAVKVALKHSKTWKEFNDYLLRRGIRLDFVKRVREIKRPEDIQGIRFTKDGQTFKASQISREFSFAKIEDYSGSAELPFFGNDWVTYQGYLGERTFLFIKARCQPKQWRQDELELKITSMELLPDVKEKLIEKITILIPLSVLNKALITELAELTKERPGSTELYFKVRDEDSKMTVDLISRPVKLSVGRELITYLKERSDLEFRIN